MGAQQSGVVRFWRSLEGKKGGAEGVRFLDFSGGVQCRRGGVVGESEPRDGGL